MLAIGLSANLIGQSNFEQKEIIGSWLGKLKVQNVELRLIFNLSENENGVLKATMDSPDQGAKGIPMGEVSFDTGELKIDAPSILGYYLGVMILRDSMTGTWNQNGQSFDLSLKKQKEEFSMKRPQEPNAPFPYLIEDVKFINEKAGHTLAGTLTIPKAEGQYPAVILISGSGAQNRNEEVFGHKPFMVIADYLTRNGIAVLRYDDQGVDESGGSQLNTTSLDYSYDAEAALKFLQSDNRIETNAIGFAGHSEGGLIAPIVAARNNAVGFFISLAGPAIVGSELLMLQTKALATITGTDVEEINQSQKINAAIFDIIINEGDNEKVFQKASDYFKKSLESEGKDSNEIEQELSVFKKSFPAVAYTWMRYFLKTNPAEFLEKMTCPILVLNGDKDLQVLSGENLKAYERIFKKSGLEDYQLIEMKNHNHLFQHCQTGLPLEYGNIEETFSLEALELLQDWIKVRFAR